MADIYHKVGARIRALRTAAGLTQVKLADQAGVTAVFMSRMESGVKGSSVLTLERVAAALGVEVRELFEFEEVGPETAASARAGRIARMVMETDEETGAKAEKIVEVLVGRTK